MEIPNNKNYGYLLNENNIKLQRTWFKQMSKMLGIKVIVKNPKDESKHYSVNGEIRSNSYDNPVAVFGIFDDHLEQKTSKKLGWNAEVDEQAAVIYLPYDLKGLQKGSLVTVPSAIDNAIGRVFRVIEMSTIMIYPASIACKLAPEWADTIPLSQIKDFTSSNMNLIEEETEW